MGAWVVGVIAFVVLGLWYVGANYQWTRALRRVEPGILVDPVSSPGVWIGTAPDRLRRLLHRLQTPESDPSMEQLRLRARNRFVIAATCGPALFLGAPIGILVVQAFATAMFDRDPGPFAAFMVGIALIVLGYYFYRAARAANRFGNGLPVARTEFVIGVLGVIATLLGMVFIMVTPLGSG